MSESKMTPTEALFHTMSAHYAVLDSRRNYPEPGDLVSSMGPEVREALTRLTSEELELMPVEILGGIEMPEERKLREAKERVERDQLFAQEMDRWHSAARLRVMFDSRMRKPN